MKKNLGTNALLCAALVGCLLQTAAGGTEANAWAFKDLRAWAREKDAVKLAVLPDGAFVFQLHAVVVVEVVESGDIPPAPQELPRRVEADESGCACEQYFHESLP